MKLTKYSHACLVIEDDGKSLVVDPGNLSDDFVASDRVTAVVITHGHADHCDNKKLQVIIERSPDVAIFALAEVANATPFRVTPVLPGQTVEVGAFHLEFVGGDHATIHPDLSFIGNIGVMVNRNMLYYAGDSFTPPPRRPKWIAVPVAAPWMKLSEAIDYLRATTPQYAFSTHDAVLSTAGQTIVDRVITGLVKGSTTYSRLETGKTIEL